jgi:hypothetical protein
MVHLLTLGEEMTIAINGGARLAWEAQVHAWPNVPLNLID